MAKTRLIPTGGSTGQVLAKVNASAYDVQWVTGGGGSGIDELSGDVTAGPGSGLQVATVTQIQGRAVLNAGPAGGDVLTWNNGASRWEPVAPSGGLSEYQVRARALYGYR